MTPLVADPSGSVVNGANSHNKCRPRFQSGVSGANMKIDWLKKNLDIKILSVILAVLLWFIKQKLGR